MHTSAVMYKEDILTIAINHCRKLLDVSLNAPMPLIALAIRKEMVSVI